MESINHQQQKGFGEYEAGIQEYLCSTNTPIHCTLKHRFSDFIVNEIDEEGNVVWFKSENDLQAWKKGGPLPGQEGQYTEEAKEELPDPEKDMSQLEFPEDKVQQLKQLLPENEFPRFMDFMERLREGSIEKSELFSFENSVDDKVLRSSIHQFFKNQTNIFDTDTQITGDVRIIRVFLKHGLSANKRRKMNIVVRKADQTDEQQNFPYLQVAVQKTNIDTMQAVHYLAKKFKKNPKYFQVAGNKDKRGITTQRVTILRGNPEHCIRFQRAKDWDKKISIGTFSRVRQPLRLGQLSGNRFSVALRFLPKEVTNEAIQQRFINYFGMQRFGTYNIRSHQIGIEVLRQNWAQVIHLIIQQHPDGDENAEIIKNDMVKYVFKQNNIDAAFELLDRRDRLEKTVLIALKKNPHGYFNAFQNISKNTRTIFFHAYQSYIWNLTVSERIRRFGDQVLIGDLVVEPEKAKIVDAADNADDEGVEQEDAAVEEAEGEGEIPTTEKLEEMKMQKEVKQKERFKDQLEQALVEVTTENINKFTLKDVVLPLVGYKVKLPKNEDMNKIMLDFMAKDGISMQDFEKMASLDASSSYGSYRKIVGFASDIEYDVVEFQNINEDLLNPKYNEEKDPTPEIVEDPTKPTYRALRVKMSLKQSNYATMMLREITRISSAFNVQSAMSRDINNV